ncbi:MAG: OmpA family protein [Bacteroidales bacterium]|nr:OmpA family protein [Bacteroidales bacterium]MBN2764190.1 OmpA family protein [Bacteroidales bacterium]
MKKLILISIILLTAFCITGQPMSKTELKEYFLDAEFFFAQEEYTDALYDYMELYNNGYNENANINYRIGVCYLNITGQKEKSIPFLNYAVQNTTRRYRNGSFKETRAPLDAWLFLGNAYRINNQLDKAIEIYNKYKSIAKSTDEINYADQQIKACQVAKTFMADPLPVRRTNLGSPVNTNSSNFKAVVSGDGKTLVYMNELPFYDAVYYSTYQNNNWTEPVNITPQLQSDGDQYVSSISYDGKTLYLTREGNFDSDILISRYENGKWTKSVLLGGNINTKYWESHASVSKDGNTLYFTSNRKGGPGSMDIFKAKRDASGAWSEPVPLDEKVNTLLNEDTPFITDSDSLLFFSSQGHVTMGGYDIQMVRLTPSGTWSEPENLRYPINTTDDDLFYYPWHNGKIGYVSIYDKDGAGKEDIYAIQPETAKAYDLVLADLIKEEMSEVKPEFVTTPREEPDVEVSEETDVEEKPAETLAPQQVETIEEQPAEEAEPVVEKEILAQEGVETIEEQPAEEAEPVVAETKTMVEELFLNPVYFAFDKYSLSETGKNELKKLAEVMKNRPASTLKLVGYADAVGPAPYNLTLSEKRAVTAMKFLVSLGIEASRLSAVGLGETNFAAINKNPNGTDNPEGRRLNRRVEFEILGIGSDELLIKRPVIPEKLRYKEN